MSSNGLATVIRSGWTRVMRPSGTMLDRILDEAADNLSGEATKARMRRAHKARRFYNFDGREFMEEFMNDAETPIDYIARPYREGGLARMACDILCEHLYSPGPARQWEGEAVETFLKRVYQDVHINSKMQKAEQLATLMDCCAIQVDAARGTFENHPVKLHLWGADEFEVWEDPDDRNAVYAVCTRDRYDLQTRLRVWTNEQVYTFLTDRADGTAGGRVAELQGPPEPNPYGMIPFAFVHYTPPQCGFWEPGIGNLIVEGEVRINDRLSRLDQSIHRHLNPIPIAKDAPDGFQVIIQPNMFLKLNSRAAAPGADGAFGMAPPQPELSYLQANIDTEGAWHDLNGYMDLILMAARVPRSAVRMEQTGVASGIALIVEQAPLLTRAKRRQPYFGEYEEELARTIAFCSGVYYGRRELVTEAQTGRMILAWPMPSIPVQTDDWLNLQLMREQAGLTSKIQITMETYGCQTRDQAIEILKQVAEDKKLEETILPQPEPEPAPGAGDGTGEEINQAEAES